VIVPSDDEFETMQARARFYRKRVAELGGVSASMIKQNVRERLRLRTGSETLTRAQDELADEIIAFLKDARLSRHQAARLEQEFFGN
jgi:CRISPR/Cas system CSM-associated protein Csm4 (group 5 of RAMP superfamily)